jgi:hypothetical protein
MKIPLRKDTGPATMQKKSMKREFMEKGGEDDDFGIDHS